MRVVLDTNVLVSGLPSPFGAPAEVVRPILSGTVTSSVDARILIEYGEVPARPTFGFDPDDEPFLEAAIAGRADALVTGKQVHVPASARAGVTVLGPSEFLAWVRDALVRRAGSTGDLNLTSGQRPPVMVNGRG